MLLPIYLKRQPCTEVLQNSTNELKNNYLNPNSFKKAVVLGIFVNQKPII